MSDTNPTAGWARRDGLVEVGLPVTDLSLRDVVDRLLVTETINRFGWAYDERDLAALEREFAADAVYEGTIAGDGPFGPFVGRTAILDWFADFMSDHHDLRRHHVGNLDFVEQSDVHCRVNAYLALSEIAEGTVQQVSSGFYRFDLTKGQDGWVFSHVFAGWDNSF